MTSTTAGRPRPALLRNPSRSASVWYVTVILFLVSALIEPGSVSTISIQSMLPLFGVLAVAAAGQTMVVMTRGLDLSTPGMISLAGLTASKFSSDHGSLVLGLLVTAIVAIVVGLLNGVVVANLRVTPLVATLAIGSVLQGASFAYSGGAPARAPEAVASFSVNRTLGVSNSCWVALVIVGVLAVLAARSVWGRQLAAVGANEHAARLSGLRVNRLLVSAYVASALCSAIAGVVLAGFVKTPNSDLGTTYLLPSIAAVVIGGTRLGGGRGRVIGTVVAALFLSQLTALVLALGAPSATQYLVEAAILAVAVAAQSLGNPTHLFEARLRVGSSRRTTHHRSQKEGMR
jgi:ribose transport system permease protein